MVNDKIDNLYERTAYFCYTYLTEERKIEYNTLLVHTESYLL